MWRPSTSKHKEERNQSSLNCLSIDSKGGRAERAPQTLNQPHSRTPFTFGQGRTMEPDSRFFSR